jgi:hypothetical protein
MNKKEIKEELNVLRMLAREIGFNGFQHYSGRQILEHLFKIADSIEENL